MAESYTNIVYTKKNKARVTFKISRETVSRLSIANATLVGDFDECKWNLENGDKMSILKDGSFSVTKTIDNIGKSYQFKYFVNCIGPDGNRFDRWITDDSGKIGSLSDGEGHVNSLLTFENQRP
ncbi:hypothetical protein IJT93_02870 [bacterium]|nr:hypothetical protein [bacterium]